MNLNKDTNVNESIFDDIREYQEITDAKDIYKLLGDIIILDRYKGNIDYLFDRVVDVAGYDIECKARYIADKFRKEYNLSKEK